MAAVKELQVEHSLYLRVCECKDLKIKDRLARSSDPYVVVTGMGAGKKIRTKTVYKELNPFYGEEYNGIEVAAGSSELVVQVWDEDKKKDELIGSVVIKLASVGHERVHEQWYPLGDGSGASGEFVTGELHLRVCYQPPDDPIPGKITVEVLEGAGLVARDSNGLSDPYVKIKHGKAKAKTKVVGKTLDPVFNEELALDIPVGSDEKQVTVSVWDHDKMSANDFMGVITLFLDELEPGYMYDEWFTLCSEVTADDGDGDDAAADDGDGQALTGSKLGSIRLKLHYKEEEILPLEAYDAFKSAVLADGLHALSGLGAVTKERGDVAYHLVRLTEGEGYDETVELLQALAVAEIESTPEAAVLFRGNSLATKALDMYQQMVALPYLHATLGTHIRTIYGSSDPAEVDPTRLDDDADLDANWARLKAYAGGVVDEIFRSLAALPTTLQVVFEAMREAVTARFPDDEVAPYTAVSGFLFLRLFCAAILGPKLFGLADDHADAETSRVLTLLSKTVQNLANLAEFGPKEPYMAPMNEFIVANIPRMKAFLTSASTIGEDFNAHDSLFIDKARERAALVRHFVKCREQLEEHASAQAGTPVGAALTALFPILDELEAARAAAPRPVVKTATGTASSAAAPAGPSDAAGPSDTEAALAAAVAADGQVDPTLAKLNMETEERKENMRKVLSIQASLSKCDAKKSLASRSRIFIREGNLLKVSKGKMQARIFYLFSDMLLYGEEKRSNAVTFKGLIPITKLIVVDASSAPDLAPEQFRLVNLLKKKVIDIHCASPDERTAWCHDLTILAKRSRGFNPLDDATQALANKILDAPCTEHVD